MENIIDVKEYREVVDLTRKTTEDLTSEANALYAQAEAVAGISLRMVAESGRRLSVIKTRVGHGEWEDWMERNLKFSAKKANRMMKLAEKMSDEDSLFSKTTTLSDFGISRVWKLLAAPEEVAEEVVENENVAEMTARELEAELKRVKEENEELRDSNDEIREQFEEAKSMKAELAEMRSKLKEAEEAAEKEKENPEAEEKRKAAEDALEKKKQELASLKAEMKQKIAEARTKAKADAEKAKEKETQDAVEAAKKEAVAEAEKEKRRLVAELAEAKAESRRLEKTADPQVAAFKVRADALQESFNKCRNCIDDEPDEERQKTMKAALKKLVGIMDGQLE